MRGKVRNLIGNETLLMFQTFWLQFRKQKMSVAGLVIVGVHVSIAISAPLLSPYDPFQTSRYVFSPPSLQFPFGTDIVGRDILSMLMWGTRASLLFGLITSAISLIVGVVLGAISGYLGGKVDAILSRLFEVFLALPRFFLMIFAVALFGRSIFIVMIIVGLTMWPSNARLMRAQVLTLKNRQFVEAAIVVGESKSRILLTHILPNGLYPIITNSILQISGAILIEASLSFLGLSDPNLVSWGQIIQSSRHHMLSAWWLLLFPGVMLLTLILGLNLVGDGVNYALNPRLKER